MKSPYYKEKKIKDWQQFKEFVDRLSEAWVFRGQANSKWQLETSWERSSFFKKYDGIEMSFLIDFQRGAKNFLNETSIPDNLIEWLALMQHHGAPTRLLDFTRSPFIASYFAFEGVTSNTSSIAVWALNLDIVRRAAIHHLASYLPEEFKKSHFELSDEIYERLFFTNDYECILPVEPFKMNKRYYLQQSLFISSANSYWPFIN